MRKADIHVHNRTYQVICDADQLDHVRQLADEVTARATKIAHSTPKADDAHILMLTCLVLADELYEVRQEAGELRERSILAEEGMSELLDGSAKEKEEEKKASFPKQQRILELMDLMAHKMETLSMKLEKMD